MKQYIIIGHSDAEGHLLVSYEEAKACNFCKNFSGYGLHACAGHCSAKNKELYGGYVGGYTEEAKNCDSFECVPQSLATIIHE